MLGTAAAAWAYTFVSLWYSVLITEGHWLLRKQTRAVQVFESKRVPGDKSSFIQYVSDL